MVRFSSIVLEIKISHMRMTTRPVMCR